MAKKILKPCPFCGGEAELRVSGDPHRGAYILAKCTVCGGASKGWYFRGDFPNIPLSESVGGHHAINAWNRRAYE